MALVKPVIYQVVGYQNSGKTTFLEKLIHSLKDHDLQTVSIKHHGHGGKPERVRQKDSSRHLEAGAMASLCEGEGSLVLHADTTNWGLEEQIRLLECFNPDIILIEGHKKKDHPKILILREKNDFSLLSTVENVKLILVWEENLKGLVQEQVEVPCFHINDEKVINLVTENLQKLVSQIKKSV